MSWCGMAGAPSQSTADLAELRDTVRWLRMRCDTAERRDVAFCTSDLRAMRRVLAAVDLAYGTGEAEVKGEGP
jgi:hypothetical protein